MLESLRNQVAIFIILEVSRGMAHMGSVRSLSLVIRASLPRMGFFCDLLEHFVADSLHLVLDLRLDLVFC